MERRIENGNVLNLVRNYYGETLPERYLSPAADLTMAVIKSMGCYERFAKAHDLSLNALLVLMALHYAEEPCTQKSIGELMWLPKQTVGSIINGFKKKGLVEERVSTLDARAKAISLTEEGARWCEALFEDLRAIEAEALRAADAAGLEAAIASVNAYTEAFQQKLAVL